MTIIIAAQNFFQRINRAESFSSSGFNELLSISVGIRWNSGARNFLSQILSNARKTKFTGSESRLALVVPRRNLDAVSFSTSYFLLMQSLKLILTEIFLLL